MTKRYLVYGIAGIIGVASGIGGPLLIRHCLANDGSREAYSAGDAMRQAEMRNLNNGNVCCSSQNYTFHALWGIDKPQPYWRGSVLLGLARDISHILGLDAPTPRGAYTDGGPIMGTGARELRGPGGTIGPI